MTPFSSGSILFWEEPVHCRDRNLQRFKLFPQSKALNLNLTRVQFVALRSALTVKSMTTQNGMGVHGVKVVTDNYCKAFPEILVPTKSVLMT